MANSFYEHSGYPPGSRARNSSQKLRDEFSAIEAGAQAIEAALALKADAADLSEVDNTSDADKPISTLTQAALDLKADYSALVDFDPATAGADKILVTNAAGDGWEYPAITAAGKALLDDASAAAQRATLGIGASTGKNLLINGGFEIWDYGTSQLATVSGYKCDNRWYNYGSGGIEETQFSRVANSLAEAESLSGSQYHCLVQAHKSWMPGSYINPTIKAQRIENIAALAGRTVTIAFDIISEEAAEVAISVRQVFGTGGSATVITPIGKLSTSTSWTRPSGSFIIPSIAGKTIGSTDAYTEIRIWFSSDDPDNDTESSSLGGQDCWFKIDNAQLEFGDTATDFEYRHPAEEWALCQRYYEKGTLRGPFAQYSTNFAVGPQVSFLVEKRKTPLVALGTLPTTGNDGTPGALYGANETTRSINPVYNWTGGTVGRSFFGQVTWTADAEL